MGEEEIGLQERNLRTRNNCCSTMKRFYQTGAFIALYSTLVVNNGNKILQLVRCTLHNI